MNVTFHKITSYTRHFQNFSGVFTILVKNLTFIFSESHEKFSLVLLVFSGVIADNYLHL